MGRLVVVLALVCGLWLGYGWLSGPPVTPVPLAQTGPESSEPPILELAAASVAPEAMVVASEVTTGASALQAPARPPQPTTEAALRTQVHEIIEGLRGSDRQRAGGEALALMVRSRGQLRERLATAWQEAAAAAPDTATRVALLGDRSVFLQCEEGRALAGEIIRQAGGEPPDTAVVTLTRLLEAAMRGPIAKDDAVAHGLIDRAYAALQAPLLATVFNPAHHARARTHKLAPGQTLSHVVNDCRRQGLEIDAGTLALFNRITDANRIQAGQVIKIPVDEIHSVVEKRSFLMAVYLGEVIVRLYWIGHGRDDRTPVTTFTVIEKLEDPDWFSPAGLIPKGHPDNELGKYFVKFGHQSFTGFGAHEARDPSTVCEEASAGCIRMRLPDIADFFLIAPRGSRIEIRATSQP